MSILALEICGCVSAADLISWRDSGRHVPNPTLIAAFTALGVDADPCSLHHHFFEELNIGHGNVFLFASRIDPHGLFVVDLYKELTDQLDLVTFGVRCSAHHAAEVKARFREFFDSAEYQVGYEESHISRRLRELIDRDRYPVKVQESGYNQSLVEGWL